MEPIKTIGTVLKGGEQRDCIHVAIMPVVCSQDWMSPGEEAKLLYGTTDLVGRAGENNAIGIIDPFLKDAVRKGERCWLFLKPGTITGLRHDWTHPAIDNVQTPSNESELWLRSFASKWNFDYDRMLAAALEDGGYVVADGFDLHSRDDLAPGDHDLFWKHVENLTGDRFDGAHREKFKWSCSC